MNRNKKEEYKYGYENNVRRGIIESVGGDP